MANLFSSMFLNTNGAVKLVTSTQLSSLCSFSRASAANAFDGSGNLASFAADIARLGSLTLDGLNQGFVGEEARTNSIPNNTMTGATASTFPTGWSGPGTVANVVYSVVGTGTSFGMPYLDVRAVGTASGTTAGSFGMMTSSTIAAVNAQTWTYSQFVQIIAGDKTGLSTFNMSNAMYSSAPAYLGEGGTNYLTSLTTSRTRIVHTTTLNQASTAYVRPYYYFTPINTGVIDITVRIWAPQMELGAFASTPIFTTSAAATRAAEVCQIPALTSKPWYNPAQGTILCVHNIAGQIAASGQHIYNINNGSATDNTGVFKQSAGAILQGQVDGTGSANGPTATTGSTFKSALAYKNADNNLYINGSEIGGVSFKAEPITTAQSIFTIGNRFGADRPFNGTISELTYYPTRLPDATLQILST